MNKLEYNIGQSINTYEINNFLSHYDEISFISNNRSDNLSKILTSSGTIVITVKNEYKNLIAVLIGGVLGTRATINHLAINNNYRRFGIGTHLVTYFEKELKNRGVLRYFLFVEKNNISANKFWEKMNFHTTNDQETTYEKNLK